MMVLIFSTTMRLMQVSCTCVVFLFGAWLIWAMVNTHYMVDVHPIHNKDPYNGFYKSLWTIGWLAPINGY